MPPSLLTVSSSLPSLELQQLLYIIFSSNHKAQAQAMVATAAAQATAKLMANMPGKMIDIDIFDHEEVLYDYQSRLYYSNKVHNIHGMVIQKYIKRG